MYRMVERRSQLLIAALVISVVYPCVSYSGTDLSDGRLSTADIIDTVIERTGFGQILEQVQIDSAAVSYVEILDDDTPFLRQEINGKELAQVTLPNVQIEFGTAPRQKDQYTRDFQVLVNPSSGEIIKIVSKWRGDSEDLLPVPTPESAERQIRLLSEMYHGFSSSSEAITFLEVLEACPISPLTAKEITAILVVYSKFNTIPQKPVWIINLRGTPPQPRPNYYGDELSAPTVACWRIVIDATTGSPIRSTNLPKLESAE